MQTYPLLDLREALADANRAMADIQYYTQVLPADMEGHLPPDAATLLANVAAVRELLTAVLPPALVQAIAAEQAEFDAEADRWEPANY